VKTLRLALRMLSRDWRAGELRVLAMALVVAVASITSVAFFADRVGNALVREQQNEMNTYISLLIQELKRAHEAPPGVSDRLEARVTFDITASGAILNPRISKSSGDKAFDESVLEAFLRMRSIGPTPNRRADTWTVTFKMRDES